MVPSWFLPALSREDAEYKLSLQTPGNFLIRQSSHSGSLALSVNTGKTGENAVQHFIINSRDGCVALEDSDLEFDSLVSLVNYYTLNREELPVALKMYTPERKISAPVGMRRGDSPYVSMVGKQRTKSTIWINSPAFRSSDDECSTLEKDLEVIKSVLEQNSAMDLSLENTKSTDEIERKSEDYSIKISTSAEAPMCNTSWKESSKSWLETNKFWLNENKTDIEDGNKSTDKDAIMRTSGCVEEKETYENKKDDDEKEDEAHEFEDYSLPIDIQNSNIYEDPDIIKSSMSPDRPSTKLVYEAFNMQESAKNNQTEMLNLSTKENLRNKISLSISSASNVSTPVSNASIVTPPQVSTPPPSIGGRQPLEPFMPLRKLSYNHNVNANRPHKFERSQSSQPVKNYGPPSSHINNPMVTRSAEYRPRFRKNNSVISPPPFRSLDNKLASSNLSKSCSDLFKEMDKKSGCVQPNELRKSFVRKVSINLSVRKSNSKPIRKISDAMKKMFPMPKSLKSLANSQINSDSWEYLAECGVNPVYEEVQEAKDSEDNKNSLNKSAMRCLSCDSLYQSDNSNSNASSMSRGIPEELPSMEKVSGDYWSERITNTSLTPSGRNTSESADSTKLKSSSSTGSADSKSQKSSSSGEKRGRASNKPQQPQAPQRAKSKNVGTRAEKILFV